MRLPFPMIGDLFHQSTHPGGKWDKTTPDYQTLRVCSGRTHVLFSQLVVVHRGAVVSAEPVVESVQTSVCDGSCRARRFDVLEAEVAEFRCGCPWGEPSQREVAEHRRSRRRWWLSELVKLRIHDHVSFHGRSFSYNQDDDGDSDSELYCCGQYHVRRTCDDDEMGSRYRIEGRCDRSCQLVPVRLPDWVADALRPYAVPLPFRLRTMW